MKSEKGNSSRKAAFCQKVSECVTVNTYKGQCFGLAWINAICLPKQLHHSPSTAGQGERKYDARLEGRDKDRERSLTNSCNRQKRLTWGEKESLIYHQSNQSRTIRNKTRS